MGDVKAGPLSKEERVHDWQRAYELVWQAGASDSANYVLRYEATVADLERRLAIAVDALESVGDLDTEVADDG